MNDIKADLDFNLDSDFLLKEAQKMIDAIKKDASEGIFQNGRGNMAYRSKEYVRYKANSMRRLTQGEALRQTKEGKPLYFSNPYGMKISKDKKSISRKQGDKLKGFNGVSTNTNTAFVDMRLTGALLTGMSGSAIKNGFTISFKPADTGKILGNQKLGRDLVGLREENKDKVAEDIANQLMKQFKIKLDKPITITIGK